MIEQDKIVEYVRLAKAKVLSAMLGMAATPKPEHPDQTSPMISDGVMALVGVAGTWTGAGVITCATSQFRSVTRW
jgi:hypothetical protein